MQVRHIAVAFLVSFGCARPSAKAGDPADSGVFDLSPGTADLGPEGTGPCAKRAGVPDRALVVSLKHDTTPDTVAVYTLESGGRVVDHGFQFTGVTAPQQVAIRADGAEAIIAYGTATGCLAWEYAPSEPNRTRFRAGHGTTLGAQSPPSLPTCLRHRPCLNSV